MAQAAVIRAHTKAQQKGSDPRLATCRGKLQSKRSKLNQEINKELRLRAGAENLFKATNNRKLKETVALELSFVNSNLQLLKEQLAELNSSVEIYQGESAEPVMPMIPLGLKETKEIDFTDPFKDFILEHYSEEGQKYEGKIREFMDLRQAMRCPHRDNTGVSILFEYYNQLYFVERRFFPPDRSLGIYFEWFDSLTGVPSSQRTVAFEKACVLFNLSALYTQLGAKQPRNCPKGLDQSIDYFLRAAGCLGYLRDNFTNGPSIDLAQDMLNMLAHLMLGQARECLVEKLQIQSKEQRGDSDIYFDLALEAQEVSSCYGELADRLMPPLADYLPYSWISLCSVKREFYWSVASLYVAKGLRAAYHRGPQDGESRADHLMSIIKFEVDFGTKRQQHSSLRSAYLNKATTCHEEAARLQRMCRELRAKHCLTRVLNKLSAAVDAEERKELGSSSTSLGDPRLGESGGASAGKGSSPNKGNSNNSQLSDLIEPVKLPGNSKFSLRPTSPDFGQTSVKDLFHELGPLAVFSAKNRWSPPRTVMLRQRSARASAASPPLTATCGYGFSITTDSPTVVSNVQPNSLAAVGGMKEGDFIVTINDIDVKWSTHDQVVSLIKKSRGELNLRIVTPCVLKRVGGGRSSRGESSSSSLKATSEEKLVKKDVKKTQSSSSAKVSALIKTPKHLSTSAKSLVWNPFKQNHQSSQSSGKTSFNSNVILR